MTPIYKPKGAAAEYGDYALNIYMNCPHRCSYCYCPQVLHKDREEFFSNVSPRKNIVQETRKQLERDTSLRGKLIHLSFIGDPYPTGYDTTTTREIIKLLKEYSNHVQILTKGDGRRDFDLLDSDDWYGITITGDPADKNKVEPNALLPGYRMDILGNAKRRGIKTWVSFEPVMNEKDVLNCIEAYNDYFDKCKIGKLNYRTSDINWKEFGEQAEKLCKELGIEYYIKDSLRAEMEK